MTNLPKGVRELSVDRKSIACSGLRAAYLSWRWVRYEGLRAAQTLRQRSRNCSATPKPLPMIFSSLSRNKGVSWRSAPIVLSRASARIGREQKISMAIDFWFKATRGPKPLADWIGFISQHHLDMGAPPPDPRVLRKPQRNYGRVGRSVRQRVDALIAHYEYASMRLPAHIDQSLLQGKTIHLAKLVARDTYFDLSLASSLAFGQKQEGELTVFMTNAAGVKLARIAFSFGVEGDGVPTALIGGMQGLDARTHKRILVKATRSLSGLRPKDAAFVVVQAVAEATGILKLRAVSNATHVLAREWFARNRMIQQDYDAFWVERGGEGDNGGNYVLPMRDYNAVLGSKRAPRLIDRYRAALSDQAKASIVVMPLAMYRWSAKHVQALPNPL
jgi:uncharacterized protein